LSAAGRKARVCSCMASSAISSHPINAFGSAGSGTVFSPKPGGRGCSAGRFQARLRLTFSRPLRRGGRRLRPPSPEEGAAIVAGPPGTARCARSGGPLSNKKANAGRSETSRGWASVSLPQNCGVVYRRFPQVVPRPFATPPLMMRLRKPAYVGAPPSWEVGGYAAPVEIRAGADSELVARLASASREVQEPTAAETQARLELATAIRARAAIRIARRGKGGDSQPQA